MSEPMQKRQCENGSGEACTEPNHHHADEIESDAEEEISIGLDQHGRVVPGVTGNVNYDFRGFHNCINPEQIEKLLADSETVFNARETEEDEQYSAGTTYFIRADEQPRTAAEQLALSIFRHHSKGLAFDPEKSGAEWWTLVIDSQESDVGAHWDKDYGMENLGVNVFPNLSTVTYLSNVGAPTCVIPLVAPPQSEVELTESRFDGKQCALVSKPVVGKHIVFDGRYFHFASSDVAECLGITGDTVTGTKRVSFLVNVWFNHLPQLAERLPDPVVPKLEPAGGASYWCESTIAPISICSYSAEHTLPLEEYLDEKYMLRFWLGPAPGNNQYDLFRVEPAEGTATFQIMEQPEDESSDEED